MPVRKAVLFCACFSFFFIKRVIFETAESTLAPNMTGRMGLTGKDVSVSFTDISPGVFPGGPKN